MCQGAEVVCSFAFGWDILHTGRSISQKGMVMQMMVQGDAMRKNTLFTISPIPLIGSRFARGLGYLFSDKPAGFLGPTQVALQTAGDENDGDPENHPGRICVVISGFPVGLPGSLDLSLYIFHFTKRKKPHVHAETGVTRYKVLDYRDCQKQGPCGPTVATKTRLHMQKPGW